MTSPVPIVHLPLKPYQISQLLLVLADWLKKADDQDIVAGGVASQYAVDVVRALHTQLSKLGQAVG